MQVLDQFSVQEKQMEVCEVCGAFLIVGDAQSRVDDHLMGKQHMGYAKIKSHIEELKVQSLITQFFVVEALSYSHRKITLVYVI